MWGLVFVETGNHRRMLESLEMCLLLMVFLGTQNFIGTSTKKTTATLVLEWWTGPDSGRLVEV